MSSLIVTVTEISHIRTHPNADRLDIAETLGWQVVIPRGQFKAGDKVVFFPPDTVLPEEVSDRFGVTQLLSKQRVKAVKLCKEPSLGLVMPVEDEAWEIGQDVSAYYGATKYEPPARQNGARGVSAVQNPLFPKYTEIENLRHFPNVFGEGEWVAITEKIHGTNGRIGIVDGVWIAGSHRLEREESCDLYWSPKPVVQTLVEALAAHHKQVIVYGEIYGADVQSLDYGERGHEGFRAFDILLDGRYVDWFTFADLCDFFSVPHVPLLGHFPYSMELVKQYASGKTAIAKATNIREGVVIKPLVERSDPRRGRVIFKYVSDDYLTSKKSDFREE